MDVAAIVVINGSKMIKSGYGGECEPRVVFRSVVGRIKNSNFKRDCYVGEKAIINRDILDFNNVFEKGHILNFDDYDNLLYHNVYNELKVAPEEHPHIFSEAIDTNIQEKITQILFETFSVPAYFTDSD